MSAQTKTRLKQLRELIVKRGASALLETHLPNVFYLSGFSGDSGALLIESSSATLFTDGRFTIQAKEEAPGFRVHIHRGPLLEAIGEHLRKKVRPKVAISPSRVSLAGWKILKKAS